MIKKIIFDLDDTLIAFPPSFVEEYQRVLDKYNIKISSKEFYNIIGSYEKEYDYYDIQKLVDYINKKLNVNLSDEFIQDFFDMYNNLVGDIDKNIIDTLEYLSSKYELVVLTNWFTLSQIERLKKANMYKYFTNVYGADIVPMKPNIDAYKISIGNNSPEECLMIGDNLKLDIEVPYSMNINVYYLNKDYKGIYPSIDKIGRLKEML